ncbi:GNAT family N-acetyltransferase [Methylobacterium organophilum]|uniref:GNAT family N-acetyltransferase n=1 Tax=Methylobacterium organophilum TaxID=410 RepID=UPI001F12E54E|nr:GNAT family N-acetyltransferase [Methylobacterium organophilum]UMY16830.1 GNAT family N-acetyltransferase [Methylobacterium organophilum]
MTAFETLRDAHVVMLTGTYLDGCAEGPDGAGYVFSRAIPDPTLNFAYGIRSPAQLDWARAQAQALGRAPAVLAREEEQAGLLALCRPEATYPARWMLRPAAEPPACAALEAVVVEPHADPVPPEDFVAVFGALSDEPFVREHLARYYLPSLAEAASPEAIAAHHIVVHHEGAPAACASLYLQEDLAGLYNVSCRADLQGRGLGSAVTAAAIGHAAAEGARAVFLQCPADGPVERLYARAGFEPAYAPVLVCLPEE